MAGSRCRPRLEGRVCFGGLDLSRTADLTAYGLVFPPTEADPYYGVLAHSFLPNSDLRNKELKDGVPYFTWGKQGYIQFIDGRIIDPDVIVDKIRESRDLYDLQAVAYDPWDSKEVVRALNDEGLTMLEFRQGYRSLSLPTKKLLEVIIGEKLRYNSNPVLTWNISNLKVDMDPAGNCKPNKSKSKEKIDMAVALVMALGCAIEAPDNAPFVSAYAAGEGKYNSIYAEQAEAV